MKSNHVIASITKIITKVRSIPGRIHGSFVDAYWEYIPSQKHSGVGIPVATVFSRPIPSRISYRISLNIGPSRNLMDMDNG